MDWLEEAKAHVRYYQEGALPTNLSSVPTLIIQTSQPKVRIMLQKVLEGDGLASVQLVRGMEATEGLRDVLFLQTGLSEFLYCTDYDSENKEYQKSRKKWEQLCKKSHNWCAVILAGGITGKGRMNPQFSDLCAFLEVPYVWLAGRSQ